MALIADEQYDGARMQLERAVQSDSDDARSCNNLGVVFHKQGKLVDAKQYYNTALQVEPEHREAKANLRMLRNCTDIAMQPQLDTAGVELALKDGSNNISLEDALRLGPGQKVCLQDGKLWRECNIVGTPEGGSAVSYAEGGQEFLNAPPLLLCYKLLIPAHEPLIVDRDLHWTWKCGTCTVKDWNKFESQRAQISKRLPILVKNSSTSFIRVQFYFSGGTEDEDAEVANHSYQWLVVRWDNDDSPPIACNLHIKRVKLIASVQYHVGQRLFIFDGGQWCVSSVAELTGCGSQHVLDLEQGVRRATFDLNDTNHAPALFIDEQSLRRAIRPYAISLKLKHGFIFDIFSDERLSTQTQIATLTCCETARKQRLMDIDVDTDDKEAYRELHVASSAKDAQHSSTSTELLREILAHANRSTGYMLHRLLLILGPAASGKTTLLKSFIMEILNQYPEHVPVLINVIDLARVINSCPKGKIMLVTFLESEYPQHAHLLIQATLQRRAVFLIDGIDEGGSKLKQIQDFVTTELLEPGYNTIITSRHSGFSRKAFGQCQLLELMPLTSLQQQEMVRMRVPQDANAERLVCELNNAAFKEIASNPLMLTMMISVYVKNKYKLVTSRSDLYEEALQAIIGRMDKWRDGVAEEEQSVLFKYLQKLASGSHWRAGQRRIFTKLEAITWIDPKGWAVVKSALAARQLPIIVAMGPDATDEEQYRFSHMSYQEYLAGISIHYLYTVHYTDRYTPGQLPYSLYMLLYVAIMQDEKYTSS
jgi:hypothetical protein